MENILLLDDSRTVHAVVKDALGHIYKVHCAFNVSKAEDVLEKEEIVLVLLDIGLEDMSGVEFCKYLKQGRYKDIPVIFITGKNKEKYVTEAFNSGASDYLAKPFLREELQARVKNHVNFFLLNEKLVDSEKTKVLNAMIVTYNHEFNNPLAIISGAIDYLAKDLDTTSREKYVNISRDAIGRITALLDKISKIEGADLEQYIGDVSNIKLG